jgi:hypothetical protein
MIRSKTTFVLGHGAAAELHFPGPGETLERIAAALDFSRASANQMTRDTAAILRHVGKLAERTGRTEEQLYRAAQRIHQAAKVGRTIEGVIDQNDDDPLVEAFGKLALAVFTLQSETRSSVRAVPQSQGALPLQTGDYWLLELGRLITAGLPRSKLEQGLADICVVSFTYDRSIEHVLPYVLSTAYGMTVQEAQRMVTGKLKLFHPLGSVGRLPWQTGEGPDVDWGNETAWNIAALSAHIRTASQAMKDRAALSQLRSAVAASARIVFLGFDFAPAALDLMIDGSLSHNPELVIAAPGLAGANLAAALRMLKRKTGVERDDRLIVSDGRCLDLLKDFSLLLEG